MPQIAKPRPKTPHEKYLARKISRVARELGYNIMPRDVLLPIVEYPLPPFAGYIRFNMAVAVGSKTGQEIVDCMFLLGKDNDAAGS